MGGGGKKGGGGGGGELPAMHVPGGVFQGAAAEQGLGQYAQSLLNPLAAMTSWASSLATGQQVNVPTPQQFAVQPGPATTKRGGGDEGKVWASQFDPTTGLVTWTYSGDPSKQWTASLEQSASEMQVDPATIKQWQSDRNAYLQYQQSQKGGAKPSTAQMGPQLGLAWQDIQAEQAATGQMPGIEAQTQALINQITPEIAKYGGLGDAQEAQAQQLYGVGYQELSDADKQIVDANALVKMTTTGEGLFPAQQAMIEQARQSEETQLASTLGGAGLGRSTQLGQLTGAADLGAAATAGALQQGNIQAAEGVLAGALGQQQGAQRTLGLAQTQEQVAQQSYQLAQAAEKLTLAGQELLAGEQAQLVSELQTISNQSMAFQKQMWEQAMNGYGVMGGILDGAAKSYGYSLDAYNKVLAAMEGHTKTQADLQAAAMNADAQSNGDLFKGLGYLLGGQGMFSQGGAGSSLLSGLGIGGGTAAGLGIAGGSAAGGAAAAAGAGAFGAAGAGGIALDATITAVGAF